jgi:hypothetical protein
MQVIRKPGSVTMICSSFLPSSMTKGMSGKASRRNRDLVSTRAIRVHRIGASFCLCGSVAVHARKSSSRNCALSVEGVEVDTGETALMYASQTLAALVEAHEKGIIHRDLKPRNTMIAKSGVKVLDFGLAKSEKDDTVTASHMVMGTPGYMAPEQKEGKPADARSDIYSFGCVLYEMLTGARVAFHRRRISSRRLERLVSRCLEEDPVSRWQSAAELERELAGISATGSRGKSLWPSTVPERTAPPPRVPPRIYRQKGMREMAQGSGGKSLRRFAAKRGGLFFPFTIPLTAPPRGGGDLMAEHVWAIFRRRLLRALMVARRMIEAIIAGEDNPEQLAALAKKRLKEKIPELRLALQGYVRDHHRFLLREFLDEWNALAERISRVEQEIDRRIAPYEHAVTLCQSIPGMDCVTACKLVAELGVNMAQFPSAQHLTAWAGLCPGNNESAGKRMSGTTRPGNKWLRLTLCQSAWAVTRKKDCYLSAQFRRLAARRGVKRAVFAVAHSMLIIAYTMLKTGNTYHDLGGNYLEQTNKEHLQNYFVKRLRRLGLTVTVTPAT